MANTQSTITLTKITFPDVTGSTIKVWGQVVMSAGQYITHGLPFGLLALADGVTVDFNGFLRCDVWDEEYVSTLYEYRYNPVTDQLCIYSNGTELAAGTAVPVTDPAVGKVDSPNIGPQTNLLMFEATFDRTTVRG